MTRRAVAAGARRPASRRRLPAGGSAGTRSPARSPRTSPTCWPACPGSSRWSPPRPTGSPTPRTWSGRARRCWRPCWPRPADVFAALADRGLRRGRAGRRRRAGPARAARRQAVLPAGHGATRGRGARRRVAGWWCSRRGCLRPAGCRPASPRHAGRGRPPATPAPRRRDLAVARAGAGSARRATWAASIPAWRAGRRPAPCSALGSSSRRRRPDARSAGGARSSGPAAELQVAAGDHESHRRAAR